MMMICHPTYTLRVEIKDSPPVQQSSQCANIANQQQLAGGNPFNPHRFYDYNSGKTGCDEVLAEVKKLLAGLPHVSVTLERFEQKP